MKKPLVAFLNTVAASGDNLLADATAKQYTICVDHAADPVAQILPPIPYGSIVSVEYIDSNAEVRQVVVLGSGDATLETIVASTRYKIKIVENFGDVGSERPKTSTYSYTSPAALSGSASTDRYNVYAALISKINAYAGNNVYASRTILVPFTLGDDGSGTELNFLVGETVTQATSSVTASVGRSIINSGTMAGGDAAGFLYLYDISSYTTLDTGTDRTWTGGTTTCVATGTAAGIKVNAGITIIDDANYFTSDKHRGGVTQIFQDGFDEDVITVTRDGEYADGIGSVLNSLYPVYTRDKRDVVSGEDKWHSVYDTPNAAKVYTKCVITFKGGVPETQAGVQGDIYQEYILYADESNGTNLTNLKSALSGMS